MKRMGMRWFWGVVLILAGVALLLNSMGTANMHNLLVHYWPVILIVLGVGEFINSDYMSGMFWLLAGVIIGLFTTGVINYSGDIWQIIWPVLIILIGIRFLLRPMFRDKIDIDKEAFASSSAVFSGNNKKISSKDFRGCQTNAVFGGVKIDLRDVKLNPKGAVVDVFAAFGGVEILVPRTMPVRIDAVAIFGGHDDKRTDTKSADFSGPTLVIRGEVIFGGIEVKD